MANIKQQKKRDITNNKRRLLNNSFSSSLKTAIKSFDVAVATGDKVKAQEAFILLAKKLIKLFQKAFIIKIMLHTKNLV